jgi:hypothetical protein
LTYEYYGQKVMFDDISLILFTGSRQNIDDLAPINLTTISGYSTGKFYVPIWQCRTLIGLITPGSSLQSGSISKVTFEIGHVNYDGSFSGSAYGEAFPDVNRSGSSSWTDIKKFSVCGIARVTGSSCQFDFDFLALRIRVYGGISGEDQSGSVILYHTRGLAETYIRPIYYGV